MQEECYTSYWDISSPAKLTHTVNHHIYLKHCKSAIFKKKINDYHRPFHTRLQATTYLLITIDYFSFP